MSRKSTAQHTAEEKLAFPVYVLHFDEDVDIRANSDGDIRHYVGITQSLYRRINQHIFGKGSIRTRYAFENEIGMSHTATVIGISEKDVARSARDYCGFCN